MEHTIFTENLKQLLMQKGMTQKQLSEKTGIPASSIASWFGKQRSYPSLEYASLIANALDCSIDYLVGREQEDGLIVIDNSSNTISDIEQHILDVFRALTNRNKIKVVGYVDGIYAGQQQGA